MDMKSTTFLAVVALVGSCSLPCLAAPKAKAKTRQELEKEVVALRQKLNEQEQVLWDLRKLVMGVGDNAVQAPFGRFLLIKNGSKCLALRITEHTRPHIVDNTQQDTSRYEWFLQTDGSMDFSKDNVQKGNGKLSSKNGASAYFQAGSFPALQWSPNDWIYFNVGGTPIGGYPAGSQEALRQKNMRMASTEWVRIEDVKPRSGDSGWLSEQPEKVGR